MEAIERLKASSRPRPTVRIGFTPDEEVGNGTQYFDLKAFGADVAYTLDGSAPDEVEDETFCADSATVTVKGQDVHPGYAFHKMINAVRIVTRLIDLIAPGMCPEYSRDREGFIHPIGIKGDVSTASAQFIVRDFTVEGLKAKEEFLRQTAASLTKQFPGSEIKVEIKESYRNMKVYLDKNPKVVEMAFRAVENCGLKPKRTAIRGGTDGSRLSAMGLPTPNICGGGKNFHSEKEWISVTGLEQCTNVVVELVHLWGESAR
jgi:tripeptide aminopeptidase